MSGPRTNALTTVSVAETMHEGVYSCPPDTALSEVAEIMIERGVHAVVVVGQRLGDAPAGVISALDLIAAATTRGLDQQAAGGSAASPAVTVTADSSLELAAHLMTRHAATHLLVLDRPRGTPIGILSTMDVVRALADDGRGAEAAFSASPLG